MIFMETIQINSSVDASRYLEMTLAEFVLFMGMDGVDLRDPLDRQAVERQLVAYARAQADWLDRQTRN